MVVDAKNQEAAMRIAASDPSVPWLKPPEIDERDDYVFTRGLRSWRAGSFVLAVGRDSHMPEPKIVEPNEERYSALVLTDRIPSGLNRISIVPDRERPFDFDDPTRVVRAIDLSERILLQQQKMRALLSVRNVAGELEGAVRRLGVDAKDDGGIFDGVAVVEEIVLQIAQSGLPVRFADTAAQLTELGVNWVEGPGPGFGTIINPRLIVQGGER